MKAAFQHVSLFLYSKNFIPDIDYDIFHKSYVINSKHKNKKMYIFLTFKTE